MMVIKYFKEIKNMETFFGYMLQFINEDSSRGDLARDMQRVQKMNPQEDLNAISTWPEMLSHLRSNHADPAAIKTAFRCWRNYEPPRDAA